MKKYVLVIFSIILSLNLFAQKNQYGSLEYEYCFKLDTFIESIEKEFHYEFPEFINLDKVRRYTYDISKFTKEERDFYTNYVGSYLPEIVLTKEYLSSHLSEFSITHIENDIIFWGFTKLKNGITYEINDKQFYEYETFSTMPIHNISEYQSPYTYDKGKYVKLKDFDIIKAIIEQKKQKMNRQHLNNIEEEKIRKILIGFYRLLGQKKIDEIIDTYFDSGIDRKEYINILFWDYTVLSYQTAPFDIYINTFFNDGIDKYDENTIFVELKYSHPINYVSFAIKRINGKYKIVQYISRYDEE